MGMLGMTTYDNKTFSGRGARIGGTDIRLVPGLIIPIGEEKIHNLDLDSLSV